MENNKRGLKEKIFLVLGIIFLICSLVFITNDLSSFLILIAFSLVFFILSKGFVYTFLIATQEKVLGKIDNKNIKAELLQLQEQNLFLKEEIKVLEENKNTLKVEKEEEIKLLKNKFQKEIEILDNKKTTLRNKIQEEIVALNLKKEKLNKDISNLEKQKDSINLNTEKEKLQKSILSLQNSQKRLNSEITELQDRKKKMVEDVEKLQFQKEMLKTEIEELENKQNRINKTISNSLKINPSELSIEYIDNLGSGLEFEQCFGSILNLLGYSNISITSGSGDFGIDVLASNDGVLYGFQCKLYSNTVGNEAVQQAYAGRNHYNCNIAIVVTNNYFTEQAKKQAQENRVILWDRNTLIEKIRKANKQSLQFN